VWRLRSIRNTSKDRGRLARFKCADVSVAWQAEVEDFVQNHLFDWRYAPLAHDNDPRVLLLLSAATDELIGIAAHERVILQANEASFRATKLEVVAIETDWQGGTIAGQRVSDVLMSGAMTDIIARVPERFARVLAVVHEDNERSIKVCRRYGFTEELSRSEQLPEYRRLLTAHRVVR
jgi:hypothetical protein